MSRRHAHFVQADIARACRAAKQLGAEWYVEIQPGGVIRVAQAPTDRPVPAGREPDIRFERGLEDAP